jgi:GntR family transcriptional regulator/MocR family aminotransferase
MPLIVVKCGLKLDHLNSPLKKYPVVQTTTKQTIGILYKPRHIGMKLQQIMDYAWLQELTIDKQSSKPIYVQLHDGMIRLITQGLLQPSVKLPSSRMLAGHFDVHRRTILAALDLLIAEQWMQSFPRKGLFVHEKLPAVKPRSFQRGFATYPMKTGYKIHANPFLYRSQASPSLPGFDDGYPDGRLAPVKELGRAYLSTLEESQQSKKLSRYTPLEGSSLFRTELAKMMNEHRGLAIKPENILVTRGSQMSYYLTAAVLLKKGDHVIVTSPGYRLASVCYQSFGANIIQVGVDDEGMNIDEVERICRERKIRCLDITSHHHHPTTVTLSPQRRLKLLQLAQQYQFAIIEDDYDYDFHYGHKPLLPLASKDIGGNVVYIGSFSKIISHAFRVGYIIAPLNLIEEITWFRRIIDRHSDPLLEEAIGKLLSGNVIQNHVRRANGIYKSRRDFAFDLIRDQLSSCIDLKLPEGGLAFWSLFDKCISLPELSARCASRGLYLSDGSFYNYRSSGMNGIRMGFASMNEQEMRRAVSVLKKALDKA